MDCYHDGIDHVKSPDKFVGLIFGAIGRIFGQFGVP